MIQRVMKELKGEKVLARDGEIGSVVDAYFDDERWAVRYLVVDTGGWLPGRKVLISPASLPEQEPGGGYVRVALTREQVEHAPGTETDPPLSRLLEEAHARYYGYPYYWNGPYLWGAAPLPLAGTPGAQLGVPGVREAPATAAEREARDAARQQARTSHVRSSAEVVGYRIRAQDGAIGHVEDIEVDPQSWAIADLVVDTRDWLPGRKVRIAPGAIEHIDWQGREVSVALSRDQIRHAPRDE